MAELPERDQALLLDMLLAANDAREFVNGMEKDQFLSSKLYQNKSALRGIPHRRLHADRDCVSAYKPPPLTLPGSNASISSMVSASGSSLKT